MLVSCWSAKGGSGTTVVSASLAMVLARRAATGALVVDLAGDVPAALGLADPGDPGLSGWLGAGAGAPADALARLELDVGGGLSLLARGSGELGDGIRAQVLAEVLAADLRPVVVDCGLIPSSPVAAVLAGAATQSLLVTRCCYLALRRAATSSLRPSGVVLVREAGRAFTRRDVEEVVGTPVRAEVAVDPTVARAVDAGLLAARLPRGLERSLRDAA